ncbi:MAG: RNA-binding protein, partial [Chloroflexi bacterium]|nr:RNA-binding protein [Chloroflexota bacterium]
MRIYVGNLPFRTNSEELRDLFAEHGEVRDCVIPVDRDSGRSRGFGFVDMDDDEARTAITALDGYDIDGRQLRVNEA